MNFAVVRVSGKQFLVKEGDVISIDKPNEITEVLLLAEESGVKIGTPLVPNVTVKTEVVFEGKGPKIRIAKFKAKSRYRRVMGFRANVTKLKILKIGVGVIAKSTTAKQPSKIVKPKTKK